MSDYTKVFNKSTGDTIAAADFNTEFASIETAVNSKYDSNDLLDEDDMATNSATKFPSQQSVKAYVDNKIVILDTPELLVTMTASVSAWSDYDMSAGGTEAAAAATAGATKAILRSYISMSVSAAGSAAIFVQKKGVGGTANAIYQVGQANADSAADICSDVNTFTVNLDSNSDFSYASVISNRSGGAAYIYLVGYYI